MALEVIALLIPLVVSVVAMIGTVWAARIANDTRHELAELAECLKENKELKEDNLQLRIRVAALELEVGRLTRHVERLENEQNHG